MTADGITTLAKGQSSAIVDSARHVVRDSTAWTALWAMHAGPGTSSPHVDFATDMVVAAFAGERPSSGYAIEIVDARHDAPSLTVVVEETQPPRDTVAAQMIVTPFHIVTLPRHDGVVQFAEASGARVRQPDAGSSVRQWPSDEGRVRQDPPSVVDRAFLRAAADSAAPSSTGLEPNLAAALAYLAGPFSGLLILLVERRNGFVRFHAWQAILGLGALGLLSAGTLIFSFLMLLISPVAFTVMYRFSELLAIAWVAAWMLCLIKAFSGARWHMPFVGGYAERLAVLGNTD